MLSAGLYLENILPPKCLHRSLQALGKVNLNTVSTHATRDRTGQAQER